MSDKFDIALSRFLSRLQDQIDEHYAKHFPSLTPSKVEAHPGRSFVKIVLVRETGGRSVHSFVARKGNTTKTLGLVAQGDILKAATWKQPAKTVRGTIYSETVEGYGVNVYGADYL